MLSQFGENKERMPDPSLVSQPIITHVEQGVFLTDSVENTLLDPSDIAA